MLRYEPREGRLCVLVQLLVVGAEKLAEDAPLARVA